MVFARASECRVVSACRSLTSPSACCAAVPHSIKSGNFVCRVRVCDLEVPSPRRMVLGKWPLCFLDDIAYSQGKCLLPQLARRLCCFGGVVHLFSAASTAQPKCCQDIAYVPPFIRLVLVRLATETLLTRERAGAWLSAQCHPFGRLPVSFKVLVWSQSIHSALVCQPW